MSRHHQYWISGFRTIGTRAFVCGSIAECTHLIYGAAGSIKQTPQFRVMINSILAKHVEGLGPMT